MQDDGRMKFVATIFRKLRKSLTIDCERYARIVEGAPPMPDPCPLHIYDDGELLWSGEIDADGKVVNVTGGSS